jgi:two-component sensor histidine kinase
MVIHELSTNAAKYGALLEDAGWIGIDWRVEDNGAGFSISWTENGGPTVKAPTHRGFGTTVVTKMIERGLHGKTRLDYAPSGLVWRLDCPVEYVQEEL